MTIPAQVRSLRYNVLKKRALEVFECHGGWLRPPEWAVRARFYPIRAAYSYLLRLHRFGLLERQGSLRGAVAYRLSERGNRRLKWLELVVHSDPRNRYGGQCCAMAQAGNSNDNYVQCRCSFYRLNTPRSMAALTQLPISSPTSCFKNRTLFSAI